MIDPNHRNTQLIQMLRDVVGLDYIHLTFQHILLQIPKLRYYMLLLVRTTCYRVFGERAFECNTLNFTRFSAPEPIRMVDRLLRRL
jgi:hypothetical protein